MKTKHIKYLLIVVFFVLISCNNQTKKTKLDPELNEINSTFKYKGNYLNPKFFEEIQPSEVLNLDVHSELQNYYRNFPSKNSNGEIKYTESHDDEYSLPWTYRYEEIGTLNNNIKVVFYLCEYPRGNYGEIYFIRFSTRAYSLGSIMHKGIFLECFGIYSKGNRWADYRTNVSKIDTVKNQVLLTNDYYDENHSIVSADDLDAKYIIKSDSILVDLSMY